MMSKRENGKRFTVAATMMQNTQKNTHGVSISDNDAKHTSYNDNDIYMQILVTYTSVYTNILEIYKT